MHSKFICTLTFVPLVFCWSASFAEDTRPAARAGHAMIVDQAADRLTLFGGFAGEITFNEIWTVRDGGWRRLPVRTPFAERTWQTVTFDERRRTALMFGGKTQERVPFGDTWLWNGSAWTGYRGEAPAPRSHHTAAYDRKRGVIVLFGGDGNGELFNDTWEWNGRSWKRVSTDGPAARAAHMSAYDPRREMVVIAGGVAADGETRLQDVWGWNGSAWQQLADLPAPLALGTAVETNEGVLIFGGWSEGFVPTAATLLLNSKGWREIAAAGPPARSGAALVCLPGSRAVLMTGGLDSGFKAMSDAWLFRNSTWSKKPALTMR